MTQDPPFQYVLLILTLSRKSNSTVSIHDVDDVNKKKSIYISNSRGWMNFSSFF